MRFLKMRSRFWFYSFFLLLLACLFQFGVTLMPKLLKWYYEKSFRPIEYTTVQSFESKLLEGTYLLLDYQYGADESVMYYNNLGEFVHCLATRSQRSIYDYGEYGYMLFFSYLYSLEKKNKELARLIEEKFRIGYNIKYHSVSRNDQTSYGCIAALIGRNTHQDDCLSFCDMLYHRMDSLYKENGNVLYREGDSNQHVDGIGLICPFLNIYGEMFHKGQSDTIVCRMIRDYLAYGVDPVTGIPAQSYNSKTKIKDRRCNWGRGVSWWLLGLSNYHGYLSKEDTSLIHRGDSTLLALYPNYTQYLGNLSGDGYDMSALIPILFYLNRKGLVKISKSQFVKQIAPYTDEKGIIRYNSPTIGRPKEKPNAYQAHFLSQGIALYMMSVLRD